MLTLTIADMSCGHCKAAVEQAIAAADPAARAEVDLAAKTARIDSAVPPAHILSALQKAGYHADIAG